MTSFFPFSSSSASLASTASTLVDDDPHLEISVTPSSSAFYAGESFSVTISFRNTRHAPLGTAASTVSGMTDVVSAARTIPSLDRQGVPVALPGRKGKIGKSSISSVGNAESTESGNAEAGPSKIPAPLDFSAKTPELPSTADYPYSPGANPAYRAHGWPSRSDGTEATIRSPEAWRRKDYGQLGKEIGHGRRARSLAIGKGAVSPQEMVWALSGHSSNAPPPLPSRRPLGAAIPSHHPHSRKESVSSALASPTPSTTPLPPEGLSPISEGHMSGSVSSRNPSRPSSRATASSSATSSRSRLDTNDDSRPSSGAASPRAKRPGPSPTGSHGRTPSYHNAYGASILGVLAEPPPTHPYVRLQEPRGTTTILWAYTRLVAHFHPSNTYIPPDPLLPLRSMLLHQPVGSGSLMTPSASESEVKPSSSRWQMSFGTGTIGSATQPSLTGSLFGLAKDLIGGGASGTLEEERKRVWNMKDLPVLETTRSLLGVDVKLKEGEAKEFTYTIQLPAALPPAYRGKAFRFSYDLVVSVNVALPGKGNRQRTKEVTVPIRIWANVSLSQPVRTYDVLKPVIQTKDEGVVEEAKATSEGSEITRRNSAFKTTSSRASVDTLNSLQSYAKHLTAVTETQSTNGGHVPPLSPSKILPLNRAVSPSSPTFDLREKAVDGDTLSVPGGVRKFRPRKGSLVTGDEDLLEEGEECGQAVEVLSRHSLKTSYDIAKDGEVVAVLTLTKSTFRLGESVLGVVTFNRPASERRVLKFCAYLESHEIIPENLLPLSPSSSGHSRQPPLTRLHAEHLTGYAVQTSQLSFSLDVPSEATPAFSLAAGEGGLNGGLEWRVKLSFLVSCPRRRNRHSLDGKGEMPRNMVQSGGEGDNRLYAATRGLEPVYKDGGAGGAGKTEVIDCEIPVKVLAGNTAFLVKPTVHIV